MLKDSHRVMGVGLAQKRGCAKFCRTSGNQAEQDGAVVVAMYGLVVGSAGTCDHVA